MLQVGADQAIYRLLLVDTACCPWSSCGLSADWTADRSLLAQTQGPQREQAMPCGATGVDEIRYPCRRDRTNRISGMSTRDVSSELLPSHSCTPAWFLRGVVVAEYERAVLVERMVDKPFQRASARDPRQRAASHHVRRCGRSPRPHGRSDCRVTTTMRPCSGMSSDQLARVPVGLGDRERRSRRRPYDGMERRRVSVWVRRGAALSSTRMPRASSSGSSAGWCKTYRHRAIPSRACACSRGYP